MLALNTLQTNNLIDVMNKIPPREFLRLRKTCRAMNSFVDRHQNVIGVIIDCRIDFHFRETVEVSVNGAFKRHSLLDASRKFSGFSFAHVSFKLDFEALDQTEKQCLLEFLKARPWRQAYLSLGSVQPEILDVVRPRWLFATLPESALEDNIYIDWFSRITSFPEIERLVYGIKDYRGTKVFHLVLQKWNANEMGSLIYVVPGLNFTFCNVEELSVEAMIRTIEQRYMKEVFETLDKFLDVERRHGGYEVHEENLLPEERYTEDIQLTYKPVGLIKIHLKKGEQEGCLAIEISQYSKRNFNVSFCFYTRKTAVEEYERRMKELLGDSLQ